MRGEGPFGVAGFEGPRSDAARRLALSPGLPALEQVAALAARLLGAESAQVSIIDAEQTVMAGTGAAEKSVGVRSDPEESLCTVTVRAQAPVGIAQTAADARVSHLPPVVSGAAASYLGVPLRSGEHVVGALCVFGAEPRVWSEDDVALLEGLTGAVISELERAATAAQYEADRQLWGVAVDAAGVGAFDWNLLTDELRWDDRLLELFGHDRETFGGDIAAFNACVHPDDLDMVSVALTAAIEACEVFEAEYRIVRPDGSVRWVSARGRAVEGPDGRAVRLLGAAHDTTVVRMAQSLVEADRTHQREVAETLQRSMLTPPPEPDHLEVVVRYLPASQAAQVGGDWYDVFRQGGGATNLVIGDVAGHDTEAAAQMGQLRSMLRGIAVTTGEGPAEVMARVDEALDLLGFDTMATIVTARLEQTPTEREAGLTTLRWASAGHPPPLVVVPPEAAEHVVSYPACPIVGLGAFEAGATTTHFLWPDHIQPMVGVFDTAPRSDQTVVLPRGSTLLLFTDGLFERRGDSLDVGLARLSATAASLERQGLSLDDFCDALIAAMRFDVADDVALIAVRLHPEDRPKPS